MEEPEDMEEERRLAYVAMTRAKDQLMLSWSASRMTFGEMIYNMPSRFLEEAGVFDAAGSGARGEFESGGSRSGGSSSVAEADLKTGSSKGNAHSTSQQTSRPPSTPRLAILSSAKPSAKPNPPASYKVNDKITHTRWGGGTILEVTGGGETEEIVVDFPSVGQKHLLAAVAPIEKA